MKRQTAKWVRKAEEDWETAYELAGRGSDMSKLVHEVWEEVEDGMVLHTFCLSGPRGENCRRTLAPGARLLATFEASSHFEAMTIYNRILGREPYTTDEPWDYQPYPEGQGLRTI
jgi:hypothetical protein